MFGVRELLAQPASATGTRYMYMLAATVASSCAVTPKRDVYGVGARASPHLGYAQSHDLTKLSSPSLVTCALQGHVEE
jgi:hypothetical protein